MGDKISAGGLLAQRVEDVGTEEALGVQGEAA